MARHTLADGAEHFTDTLAEVTDGIRIRGSGVDTATRRRDEGRNGKRSMGRFTRSVPRNLRS